MPRVNFRKLSKSSASYKKFVPKGYRKGKYKYIIVTGGVLSGLGKGVAAASIGKILQSKGYKVVPLKIDGYVNIDAGTMNPFEHGEVFVLDDGTEVDMDLGTYERFLGEDLVNENNLTTGKIFKLIIEKEREGKYLGKTVQVVPHVTGEVKRWMRKLILEQEGDVEVIEIGGTVGDIESLIFLESVRELQIEEGRENVMFIHVTFIPYLKTVRELKTKPTQNSVKALREIGIQPDVIVGRARKELDEDLKKKISLFCNVPTSAVISDPDVENVYKIPLILHEEGVTKAISNNLKLNDDLDLSNWRKFVRNIEDYKQEVNIAVAGKYTGVRYSYASILKALKHAGAHWKTKVNVRYVETTEIGGKKSASESLEDIDGLIVPGGFGARGVEGKIECIKYVREKGIPFLGLCFGMQLAVVEFARNVCGLENANSTEVDPKTPCPVVDVLPEQKRILKLGGTMRLGAWPAELKEGSLVRKIYGKEKIWERHRHRFEINPKYVETLEENGLLFSGKSPRAPLMEFMELPDHNFFIGTQAHPEFKSRPLKPSPLFRAFIKASR